MIQLHEDGSVNKMVCSKGRKVVHGTWDTMNGDPGPVTFTGRKMDGWVDEMDIDSQQQDHDQRANDKANRDRWKRW